MRLLTIPFTLIFLSLASIQLFGQTELAAPNDDQHQAILKAIKQGQLEAAGKLLDFHLANRPHDHDLWLLHRALANGWARQGKRDLADEQLEKLLGYIFNNPTESRPILKHIPQILINITYIQSVREPEASRLLDPAINQLTKAVNDSPNNLAYSSGLTSIVNYKAMALIRYGRKPEALATYQRELDRLRLRCGNQPLDPNCWFHLAFTLKTAARTIGNDNPDVTNPWLIEQFNILNFAVREFTKKPQFIEEFFDARLRMISEYEELAPSQVPELYDETLNRLKQIGDQIGSRQTLIPLQVKIEKRLQRFTRLSAKSRILNQPLPATSEIQWIQGSAELAPKNIEKTTILYFDKWSTSSGFHELKRLKNLLGMDGAETELVFVMPQIGKKYTWLNSFSRTSTNTPERRLELINKFRKNILQPNQFEFPVGLIEDPVTFADQLGITETPFAVIISPTGDVIASHSGKGLANSINAAMKKSESN